MKSKEFYKKLLILGIPIALQGLINTFVNLLDTVMIGQLGQTEIAAVGLANKVFFVYTLLIFGVSSGSAILSAQYFGAGDEKSIKKVLGVSLITSVVGSMVFMLAGIIVPEGVMRIFTPDVETIEVGARYLRIVAFTYPLVGVSFTYIMTLRAINKVKISVITSLVAICINGVLNYCLIFGNFGFPRMLEEGAAIATLIARVAELVIVLLYVYLTKSVLAAKFGEMFVVSKKFIKRYFITVGPVILNEFIWGLGVTVYSLVYGRMGTDSVAAITICQTIEQLSVVLFQGLSNAAGVALGNELGSGRLDKAQSYALNLIKISVVLSIVMGVLLMLTSPLIINIFNVTDEVKESIKLCLLAFSLYLPLKMANMLIIVGILRSGGDTKSCLLIDFTGVWLIGIPMAFLGGLYFKYPIHIVYAMVMIEELYKIILAFKRVTTKKWIRNITV